MPAKLNQSEMLHGLLQTLVAAFGIGRVRDALDMLEAEQGGEPDASRSRKRKSNVQRGSAMALAEGLDLPAERKALILTLARGYDDESAFPTLGDARAFLMSHHGDARDIKTRPQAFKRILPLLIQMSEKGLETTIARSRHSGPAELDAISKAIREAGETMRGEPKPDIAPPLDTMSEKQVSELPLGMPDTISDDAPPPQASTSDEATRPLESEYFPKRGNPDRRLGWAPKGKSPYRRR